VEFLRSILEALWRLPARIFGSRNQRLLKQYSHFVQAINALEPVREAPIRN
jgi:preprotein translocase subunit SecA